MNNDGLLRVKEVARLLGVAPNTIRAWGAAGKIPEFRHPMNNYRLYKKKDIQKIHQQLQELSNQELPSQG